MEKYGLLFDMQYCVGCMSCTVACKQENQYDADTWGIKVNEMIYTKPDGKVQVEFLPFPTELCTLCAARIASGEDTRPSCVKHCMTQCISYGRLSDLAQQISDKPRAVLYAGK
jgi:Fe-S-cluster-containing dehydrogenase component